jgi:integrase/recombinase XerD
MCSQHRADLDIGVSISSKARTHATPHTFRHAAAVLQLRNGRDLVSLQHVLERNNTTTTRRYLEVLKDEDLEDKSTRTSPLNNWRL